MKPLPYKPDYAVLPGATIKEILETKKQTITDLARGTGETVDTLVDVIEGRLPIGEDLAQKFEKFLGPPASFWLNAQDNYDSTVYRLFWERCRKKPNLFAHFTDDQLEAMQFLLDGHESKECPADIWKTTDLITDELQEEYKKRFFGF